MKCVLIIRHLPTWMLLHSTNLVFN
jgi:hypothetical protein